MTQPPSQGLSKREQMKFVAFLRKEREKRLVRIPEDRIPKLKLDR